MKYIIINFADVTSEILTDCVETNMNTLRHSVSGTDRVLLKYEGADPPWVTTLELVPKTHTEILEILAGSDWTEETPI